jgi:hypothetical protein
MIRPPSLQKTFDLVWSGDPALNAPVRGDADSDAAWEATSAEWRERLRTARELGEWGDLIRPGQVPTRFTVKPVPGTINRLLQDDVAAGRLGHNELFAWMVRVTLVSIADMGVPFKIENERHERYGRVAKDALIDFLDDINPTIVIEIGATVASRAVAPPGK